jgi:hypothetical protein
MQYDLDAYAVGNIEGYYREVFSDNPKDQMDNWHDAIEHWVNLNSGDFQSVEDFRADIETSEGNIVIEWQSEDSEITYNDCMFGDEE